jgi:hypothetical protein
MKYIVICILLLNYLNVNSQVQRAINGSSVIRENIISNTEFHFFRDWSRIATFKSGIGETVELFPIVFTNTMNKSEIYGLQLDAEVKPRNNEMKLIGYSGFGLKNKDFIKRSIFIDKIDVGKMITYMERDVIPHLKDSYKDKSKEYVFKSRELFFAFLIYGKDARITMHISDFGPIGDGSGGGDQIEFWTETQVDDFPKFLSILKSFYLNMK